MEIDWSKMQQVAEEYAIRSGLSVQGVLKALDHTKFPRRICLSCGAPSPHRGFCRPTWRTKRR